tara:strand:- start:54656 stop:55753 length:1098 start_codon:yes stop_codon:yes gene_type:complete
MDNLLKLALPVMLHEEGEIQAFLKAKERIEGLGEEHGVPIDVGAFLLYLPGCSRTPESFEAQVENQRKHKLPIRLVETGVQRENSLAYAEGDPRFDLEKSSDLEIVIDQAARLRDLDPNPSERLVVSTQVGVYIVDIDEGDFSKPGFYSPKDFFENREFVFDNVKNRFAELKDFAARKSIVFALENVLPADVQDSNYWHVGDGSGSRNFELHYAPFTGLNSVLAISQGNLVFDVAHLVASIKLPNQFTSNGIYTGTLFDTMGVSSWGVYHNALGKLDDYLDRALAVHISQVEGIGLRLPAGTDEARHWGGGGELPPLISVETHRHILRNAQERGLPVALEPDYGFKPLNYKEADELLEPILEGYL